MVDETLELGGTYTTGLLSVANGATNLTVSGALLTTQGIQGDMIYIPTASALIFVKSIIDDETVEMSLAWEGSDLEDVSYILLKSSWFRYDPAITQAKVRETLAYYEGIGFFYFVAGAEPDPGIGKEGQFALKINAAPWKIWYYTGGEWVLQGSAVGLTYVGEWNSSTAYFVNDRVSRNGTTYIAKTSNTNRDPATDSSATYWDTSGTKGDRGSNWTEGTSVPSNSVGLNGDMFSLLPIWDIYQKTAGAWVKVGNVKGADGGAITIPYTFDTATIIIDPGAGKLRFNNATQNAASVIAVSTSDNLGRNWLASLDDLVGTSDVIQNLRIYKTSDQTKYIQAKVTAVNSGSGFRGLAVSIIGSSSTNPFANGDNLTLAFSRVGDKGDKGDKGDLGTTYRETAYSSSATYVNNATYIDRVVYDGQTWTCVATSVTGITPGSDPTKWILASRGVSPSVIDAAIAARDQAQEYAQQTEDDRNHIDAVATQVSDDAAAAANSESAAHQSAVDAQDSAESVLGQLETALAIVAQASDDGDADDGTGTDGSVDDGDADI